MNTGHCTHLGAAVAALTDFFFGFILAKRVRAFAFALLLAPGRRRKTTSLTRMEAVTIGTFSRTSIPSVPAVVLNVKCTSRNKVANSAC